MMMLYIKDPRVLVYMQCVFFLIDKLSNAQMLHTVIIVFGHLRI